MLNVIYVECCYAECHYAECRYAECRYAECRYAECHYAECRYADCCGAVCLCSHDRVVRHWKRLLNPPRRNRRKKPIFFVKTWATATSKRPLSLDVQNANEYQVAPANSADLKRRIRKEK
jgi:hypothetical protein